MAGKPKQKLKKDGTPYETSTGRVRKVKADQTTWRTKIQQSRIKFDDVQKKIYLEHLARTGLKGRSALVAGVCARTVGTHLENDPDFAEAYEEANDAYRDKFVDHATTLAHDGIQVTKYDKDGNVIEERKDYPIRLIELELKRVEPTYRDKQQIDLNTNHAGVLVAPAEMTPEAWIAQQEALNDGKEPPEGYKPPGDN